MDGKTQFILLLLTVSFCFSCNEDFKRIGVKEFNSKVKNRTDIKTATSLIFAYDTTLVKAVVSNPQKLSVESKAIGDNRMKITAIINVYDDDELKAEKFVMIAEHKGDNWRVFEIRYNWKNQPGYGHAGWGI